MTKSSIGKAHAISLCGLQGIDITIEATLLNGLPNFTMVGLADTAITEAKERLRASFQNIGLSWPNRRLIVSLSPADTVKSGAAFDLGIAVAIMGALGYSLGISSTFIIGELGLDGEVRPVRGVLPALLAGRKLGFRHALVPVANKEEARLVQDMEIKEIANLEEIAALVGMPKIASSRMGVAAESKKTTGRNSEGWNSAETTEGWNSAETVIAGGSALRGLVVEPAGRVAEPAGRVAEPAGRAAEPAGRAAEPATSEKISKIDMAEVAGQEEAIWALEIAAIGGHHVQMLGPPGVGKSMLAERFPDLLPPLATAEALEVAAIRSICGLSVTGLPRRRPFIAPHHSVSSAAFIGGGSGIPRPGAITLAHRGVLYCDEFAEFQSSAIQALRQPLEKGWIEIQRTHAQLRYPAAFQLLTAANLCRCGMGAEAGSCVCTPRDLRIYRRNLGGPVRDRIDIRILLRRPSQADLYRGGTITSQEAYTAVVAGRERQKWRLQNSTELRKTITNSELPGKWLRTHTSFQNGAARRLENFWQAGQISLRGIDKILRISWSVADFFGHASPTDDDIAAGCLLRGVEGII